MPSLTPRDDDFDFARQILAPSPSSTQRDHLPSTMSASPECTINANVQQSVEEKQDFGEIFDDDGEDINADFDRILIDAKDNFTGKKADFVITGTRVGTSKIVDMGDDQTAEMTFVSWDHSKDQGFWVLQDNHGQKHIVKHFSKGRCYREWLGPDKGFDKDPVAWPEKTQKPRRSSTVEEDNDDIEADQSSENDFKIIKKDPDESGHGLRKRTWSQKNPYKADKYIHAAAQKGKVKRLSDLDAEEESKEDSKPGKKMRKSSPKATRKSSKPPRSRSSTNISDKPTLDPQTLKSHIMAKTTLKTALTGSKVSIPLFLSKCPDATTLWDRVSQAWEDEYEGQLKSLEIQFSWLGTEYHFMLKPSLEDSYDKMIEEIQDAPCWKDGTDKCTVDVVLVVA